jgi:hypothetical protein
MIERLSDALAAVLVADLRAHPALTAPDVSGHPASGRRR